MNHMFAGRIRYYTRFLPSLQRGGGSRRMLQICEALKNSRLELIAEPRGDGISDRGSSGIHPFIEAWGPARRQAAQRLYAAATEWAEAATAASGPDLAFIDDPIYFPPLQDRLEQLGVDVIAVCHNLESLVPSQFSGGDPLALLEKEIASLRRCRGVVAISREETVLLTNLGIRAAYFPYRPPQPIVERLLRVRRKRRWSRKSGLLLLGSAFNQETVTGMQMVMDSWSAEKDAAAGEPLHVAGFNTETRFRIGDASRIRVHGTLNDDELDRLLVYVRACICHQEAAAGALTRIPEMLTAGIPVLANSHAARSHYGRPGVVEYRYMDELARLWRDLPHRKVPPPPAEIADPPSLERLLNEILTQPRN